MTPPPLPPPELEPLTRVQVLVAMGVTAVVLLVISKVWLYFDPAGLLPLTFNLRDALLGIGIGLGITLASAAIYQVWANYRQSANAYLEMVLRPLHWADLLWLGLLPGLSEELLFRGVMLPAIGLNGLGILVSGASFGVLHQQPQPVALRGVGYADWPAAGLLCGGNREPAGAYRGPHCDKPGL